MTSYKITDAAAPPPIVKGRKEKVGQNPTVLRKWTTFKLAPAQSANIVSTSSNGTVERG